MKEAISVLLVDDNVEFYNLLNVRMNKYEDMHIIGIAEDGIEAMELIDALKPDVVLLDIIMPNLDGIGVLERFARRRNEARPVFIVISSIGQDVFVRKTITLGAEYYIMKPFDVGMLVSRIRQILNERYVSPISENIRKEGEEIFFVKEEAEYDNGLEIEITGIVRRAGISPNITGYNYIREAVAQILSGDRKTFSSITKVIYPAVASKFNTTPRRVESSIRNAIDNAWCRAKQNNQDTEKYSGVYRWNSIKPKNSEFIATLADIVRINLRNE